MFRRLSVVMGGALLAAALAGPAHAVEVKLRVEGARATIWGKANPTVEPVTGTFSPPSGADVTVSRSTPFGALERGSRRGEFFYSVRNTGFGPYVDRIGRREAVGSTGWVFKVNHVSPPVGADAVQLRRGDEVLWYFARFGSTGGPKTLDLERVGRGCFRAFAYDDAGNRSKPGDVTFVRNSNRRIVSDSGRLCPGPGWKSLRAAKDGMIRSELVRR